MPSQDLLHQVRLCDVSADAREQLKVLLREVLAEHPKMTPVGALRAAEAAAYIGLSRSKFYVMLKEDAALAAMAVPVSDTRVWRPPDLDQWLQDRRTLTNERIA